MCVKILITFSCVLFCFGNAGWLNIFHDVGRYIKMQFCFGNACWLNVCYDVGRYVNMGCDFRASVARSFANFAPCFYYQRGLFVHEGRVTSNVFCAKIYVF